MKRSIFAVLLVVGLMMLRAAPAKPVEPNGPDPGQVLFLDRDRGRLGDSGCVPRRDVRAAAKGTTQPLRR